jgi:prepilin-type processing-associated H-X9-DG protein
MKRTGHAAFSLTELVVCAALVAMLTGLLLPAIRVVKETANMVKCANGMRQVGSFLCQFEADNRGRMVGSGYGSYGSISWNNIINIELLADEAVKLPRFDDPPGTNLLCPNFNPPPLSYKRCFTYNYYAAGGASDRIAKTSQYGQVIDPPSSRNPAYDSWKFYCLGAPRAMFAATSTKVLLQESYGGGDTCLNNGSVHFRHRGAQVANFLYFDGRVESHHRTDDLSHEARYGIQ